MMFHGYELTGEWKNSQCGQTAKARKGGKGYFLKKYQTPVAPLNNGTLDAKTFAHNKKLFEKFVDTRKRINAAIRTVTGPGGNIVIPCDEFIEGNQYGEAAELVDGVVDDDELKVVLAGLSVDVKKLLMQTAAGALSSVHSKKIVHSDLKLKNVLLVRNSAGNYVAKLIDFDSSYFVDEKPDEVVGTIDYYSPELGAYADAEDDREEMGKKLTEKSDIFSLGLIFHFYLSGELPTPVSLTERLRKRQDKGKVIYCWIALNSGCELQISSSIKSPKYISLIRDMLSLDPGDRPSASEVLIRLREAEPVIEEPWPEHSIILDKDKLKADGIVGLRKQAAAGQKKYELLFSDGKKTALSKDKLISGGYVKVIAPVGFCKPWGEHSIEFDVERIKSRGFISGEQAVLAGVKGYNFYRSDSTATFFKLEMLLSMKYARKAIFTGMIYTETDSPWPEHNIAFDPDAINARGFINVKRDSMGGIKGYRFTKPDGSAQFIRVEVVLLQKMAHKV